MTRRLVKDIDPIWSSNPGSLTNVNGALLFVADDGLQSNELRRSDGTHARSDGTDAGTTLVAETSRDGAAASLAGLANVDGAL